MEKKPINPDWFSKLSVTKQIKPIEWLRPFAEEVEKIANFGCWQGREPFKLLWTLDATEIIVIEKEELFLAKAKELKEQLPTTAHGSLDGRSVEFILGDMTTEIPSLQPDYFDLAYCQKVLYQVGLDGGLPNIQKAIHQMVRCVKPGGLVIAVEGLVTEFENEKDALEALSRKGPTDISSLFETENLSREDLGKEDWFYCYRKPKSY